MASGALQGWGAVVVAAFALGCCLRGGVCVDVELLPRPLLLWCEVALSLIT